MADSRPKFNTNHVRSDAVGCRRIRRKFNSFGLRTSIGWRLTVFALKTLIGASPVCSPARASWLSGLYPHAHLQLRNYGPGKTGKFGCYLPHDCITIGDVLKAAGYRCGMVGPWHLGEDRRPQHGFTDFWCAYRYLGDYPDPLFDYFEQEGVPNLYLPDAPGMTLYENTLEFGIINDPRQQRTTWTVDRSIEFIQQADGFPVLFICQYQGPTSQNLGAARASRTLSGRPDTAVFRLAGFT